MAQICIIWINNEFKTVLIRQKKDLSESILNSNGYILNYMEFPQAKTYYEI